MCVLYHHPSSLNILDEQGALVVHGELSQLTLLCW